MTAVTDGTKYEGWDNDIKTLTITLTGSPASGYTYDTNMDTAATAEFREIFSVEFYKSGGSEAADTKPSWDTSTGIITLGTITTTPASGYLVIKGK